MKIAIVMPRKEKNRLSDLKVYVVPLTPAQLAGAIPEGHDIKVFDENLTDFDYSWKPDLALVSVMTSQYQRAMEISKQLKEKGSTIIWGGIHPTVIDQSENKNIDSFFVGEADLDLPQVIKDKENGSLKRRYESKGPVDLLKVPLPRRDVFPSLDGIDFVIETVIAGRGCPYNCDHCSASQVYGRKIRYFSIDYLLKDISKMKSPYGAFADDNLFSNTKYALEVLEAIKGMKKWMVQVDPKTGFNKKLIKSMADSDVKVVLIGFESAYSENFTGNKKYVPPEKWKEIVGNFHEKGILVA